MDASSSTENRGAARVVTGAACAAVLLVLRCGGVAVVEEGGQGGASSSGNATSASVASASQGSGAGVCVPCKNMFGTAGFLGSQVCPGRHQEALDALVACACQPATCAAAYLCEWPDPGVYLVCNEPSGYADGPCSSCMQEHCFDEWQTCRELPSGEG